MATNELFKEADSLPYIVAPGIVSGDIVVFASGLVGIAETDAEVREDGKSWTTVRTQGVWGVPITGALANAGVTIYASTTAVAGQGTKGTATTTAGTAPVNATLGTLYLPKPASGAGTAYVRIGAK